MFYGMRSSKSMIGERLLLMRSLLPVEEACAVQVMELTDVPTFASADQGRGLFKTRSLGAVAVPGRLLAGVYFILTCECQHHNFCASAHNQNMAIAI